MICILKGGKKKSQTLGSIVIEEIIIGGYKHGGENIEPVASFSNFSLCSLFDPSPLQISQLDFLDPYSFPQSFQAPCRANQREWSYLNCK